MYDYTAVYVVGSYVICSYAILYTHTLTFDLYKDSDRQANTSPMIYIMVR